MSHAPRALEVLQIKQPCPADWEEMAGDGQRRFCKGCQKYVHNLSAMTRDEAERLVCAAAQNLCVRYSRTADGNVMTVEYAQGANRQPTRRGWRFWTGIGLATTFLGGIVQGFLGNGNIRGGAVQGQMCTRPFTTAPSTAPTTGPVPIASPLTPSPRRADAPADQAH